MVMDEKAFTNRLLALARQTYEETGYNPTAFIGMLYSDGGVTAARRLIHKNEPSEGYYRLWRLKRLGLTVEAVVFEELEWHSLFIEEDIEACRARLDQYEYFDNKPDN